MAKVTFAEGATPATPASGKAAIYFKTDGKPYYIDDSGNEHAFGHVRIDTSANKGAAADYVGEWFLEDRTGGSTPDRGDNLWLSWRGDDGVYIWEDFGTAV